jgi:hypothetical protein
MNTRVAHAEVTETNRLATLKDWEAAPMSIDTNNGRIDVEVEPLYPMGSS